jgi:hypothetical protein
MCVHRHVYIAWNASTCTHTHAYTLQCAWAQLKESHLKAWLRPPCPQLLGHHRPQPRHHRRVALGLRDLPPRHKDRGWRHHTMRGEGGVITCRPVRPPSKGGMAIFIRTSQPARASA